MTDIQQNLLSDFIEQPKPANIGKRMLAAIIDGIIILLLFLAFAKAWGDRTEETTTTTVTEISSGKAEDPTTTTTSQNVYHLSGWPMLAYMVAWFLVIPLLEGLRGQTVGKMITQIKVIRQNGAPTSIGISFVRHLFDGIDCIFLVGLIIALTNPKRTRIGDLVASTYVVEKP